MRTRDFWLGGVTLVIGVFLWLSFSGASQFRAAFGGEEISKAWFVIPVLITFGGPLLYWVVLPLRRRSR